MLGLYREHYRDFTVKHFHEEMVRTHAYTLGYTVTKQVLQSAGLVARQAPHEASAPAIAGDVAVPGWLDASLAARCGHATGSDRDA
jgi:hypothetical protein